MKKLFLLLLFAALTSRAATYQVALPGGGTLVINGLPYANPQITNTASVVWTTNAQGLLTATATAIGTNASIIFVEGSSVSSPNFGLSTEIDPAVVTTNVTFSIVNSSITTNKIDPTFYTLLMQSGSGDVTAAGNNTFTGTNIFSGSTTISNLTITTAEVGTLILDSPIGVTAVGTNAADARSVLGVTYDVDVQAYRLELLQSALALTAAGHMIYHNGSLVTNLTSTSAGRTLLTAADATAQRTALAVGQLTNLTYSVAWSNVTDQTPTLGVLYSKFESLPGGSNAISSWNTNYFSVSGGYLDWVGGATGGGGSGGYTYLVTNSLGAWQGRDSSTNWTILSTTISSNDVPAATGKFIDGGWSLIASNNSGTTATLYMDVSVGGTQVFRDSYAFSSGAGVAQRPMAADFKLIRESSTTASLVQIGQNVNSSSTPIGHGDFGSTAYAATIVATNIPVTWSSNVQFSIAISCDTSTSTNAALGIRVVNSWLRKEAATSTGGSITADGTTVTNIVSSASITNTVASGQTTLSIRNSGVSAGTYSNATVTVSSDGRITSASSGSSANNPLSYYVEAEFMPGSEANVAYYGFPLLSGGVINGGAVALGSSAGIYVAGLNGIIRVRNTTSADAGAQYISDTAAIVLTGDESWGATWYSQSTNLGIRLRVGLQDSKTTTAPVDGIYAEQIDNALRFLVVANSITNAGATTFVMASNMICRATAQLTGTNSVLVSLTTNGVAAFSETITGGIPAGVDRSTGVGIIAYHTNNVAQNLCYVDKVWFGKASSLLR